MILSFSGIMNNIVNNPEQNRKNSARVHVDLNNVLNYLKSSVYPENVRTKSAKSNFRKQCKTFKVVNGLLFYKRTNARVIMIESERLEIIKTLHCGDPVNPLCSVQSNLSSTHRGRDATRRLLKQRYLNNVPSCIIIILETT